MFLRLAQRKLPDSVRSKRGTKREWTAVVFKCDHCGIEFERRKTKEVTRSYTRRKQDALHFCSKECVWDSRLKGGALYKQTVERTQLTHNVDCILQLEEVRRKALSIRRRKKQLRENLK